MATVGVKGFTVSYVGWVRGRTGFRKSRKDRDWIRDKRATPTYGTVVTRWNYIVQPPTTAAHDLILYATQRLYVLAASLEMGDRKNRRRYRYYRVSLLTSQSSQSRLWTFFSPKTLDHKICVRKCTWKLLFWSWSWTFLIPCFRSFCVIKAGFWFR